MIDETALVAWLREEDSKCWNSEAYRSVLAWIADHREPDEPVTEDRGTVARIVDYLEHQVGMAMSRREDTLSDMEAYGAMCVVTTLLSMRHWIEHMEGENEWQS